MTELAVEFARQLDTDIRALARQAHLALEALYALVEAAQANEIHRALGFPSWTAYTADALDGQWKVERDKRGEAINFLRSQGMSVRAIAKTTGIGHGTVQRELSGVPLVQVITGMDGKSYPSYAQAEESDDEWLARKLAEPRTPLVVPDTVEALRVLMEELDDDEQRLERIRRELTLKQLAEAPPGWKTDAAWAREHFAYARKIIRRLLDNGLTVEQVADEADVSVTQVQDYLDAVGFFDIDAALRAEQGT
ncbi:MAG: hypothetical protein QOG19_2858 [Mycobacterium sp.]|jgi:DNA-binding NarL/FixJ family response regulator|nr:hypothetical protein [Mycobacterium sp.]